MVPFNVVPSHFMFVISDGGDCFLELSLMLEKQNVLSGPNKTSNIEPFCELVTCFLVQEPFCQENLFQLFDRVLNRPMIFLLSFFKFLFFCKHCRMEFRFSDEIFFMTTFR